MHHEATYDQSQNYYKLLAEITFELPDYYLLKWLENVSAA
jgi:hypothetical protein